MPKYYDVLTGGFPCQSFSARGQRRGLDDPRGALYREILRTLVACRPRAFLLENVEGLATMDDGEVLDVIVADLRAAGYDVETKIIDAAGWVPQSRRRVFFVGFRVDDAQDDENVRRPWTTTADSRAARRSGASAASRFRWPTRTRTRGGTVRDVLEDECGNDATAACEVSERQTRRAARFFRRRDEETNVTYLEADLDGVARTLVASYRKSSAYNAELVAPAGERRRRPRYYTAREAARLQGFPESFALDPDRGHHELGNSVAVPLVRDIAVEMLRALGVEDLPGHLFLLYFAVMSALTPPVAVAEMLGRRLPRVLLVHGSRHALARARLARGSARLRRRLHGLPGRRRVARAAGQRHCHLEDRRVGWPFARRARVQVHAGRREPP